MAEPILGQALALQSEFRPDTTQVLTKAVDKIGNVTLKKQLAAQKAAEARAKREQEILSAVKLDGAKVNRHFLPEAQKKYAQGIAQMQEYAMKGDILGVNNLKGQLEMEFDNLAKQSDAVDKFIDSEKQGFIVPQELKVAFSMPKAQGQAYLQELFKQKPELRGIVDVNEYGDYAFNTIKNIDPEKEFTSILDMNENLYSPTGTKVIDEKTKDQLEVYKISDDNIRKFAQIKAQDPEFRANIFLKNKKDLEPIAAQLQATNKNLTPQEATEMAVEGYIYKQLSDRNKKTIKSNIPQGKGGFNLNIGGGGELSFDMDGNPTNGVIPIQVEASTTTPSGRKVSKTFDRGVPTGNNLSFNTVEVLNTRGENVVDMETNMPLEAKMLQSTKVGDVVAVPIATKDFVGANGVNYKKGQMVDGKVLKTAMERGLASYQPMVKGIASYMGKLSGKDQMVQKSVLIPAGVVRTGVISSQSGKNQEFINSLFDKAIQEANELNAKARSGKPAPAKQYKPINTSTPKKGIVKGQTDNNL